jgi:hypothetical protein
VPFPGSLVKSIVPSWSCTIRNVMAKPIPEPSFRVVKYKRKIFSRNSWGMPAPVSATLISDRLHAVYHHVENGLLDEVAIHADFRALGLAPQFDLNL